MIGKKPNVRQVRVDPGNATRLLDCIVSEINEKYVGLPISIVEQEASYRYRREILRLHDDGRSMRKIAPLVGVSQPRVSQIVGEARESIAAGQRSPLEAWMAEHPSMVVRRSTEPAETPEDQAKQFLRYALDAKSSLEAASLEAKNEVARRKIDEMLAKIGDLLREHADLMDRLGDATETANAYGWLMQTYPHAPELMLRDWPKIDPPWSRMFPTVF